VSGVQTGIEQLEGETVGFVRFGSPIGRGTLGWVLEGTDLRDDQEVAIKILAGTWVIQHPELFDDVLDRYRDLVGFIHPQILPVTTVHLTDGPRGSQLALIVAPLLRGGNAESHQKKIGRGKLRDATRIAFQVASGLSDLHHQGVVHGDLKLTNILLDQGENVRISDTGVSCLVEMSGLSNDPYLDRPLPLYYSPEQCRGKDPTQKSDIYALGACFYHLLAGEPPFPSKSLFELLDQHTNSAVPDVSEKIGAVSDKVYDTILQAMAKDPGERYPSVDEMAADLAFLCGAEWTPPVRNDRPVVHAPIPAGPLRSKRTTKPQERAKEKRLSKKKKKLPGDNWIDDLLLNRTPGFWDQIRLQLEQPKYKAVVVLVLLISLASIGRSIFGSSFRVPAVKDMLFRCDDDQNLQVLTPLEWRNLRRAIRLQYRDLQRAAHPHHEAVPESVRHEVALLAGQLEGLRSCIRCSACGEWRAYRGQRCATCGEFFRMIPASGNNWSELENLPISKCPGCGSDP
jgi:serine/threonine protein kinase